MIRVEHSVIGMCATNTYYAFNESTGEGFIVDPAGDVPKIIDRVSKYGFRPNAVVVTHGHFDHVLAMQEVCEHYGIKSYIGAGEKEVLSSPDLNLTASFVGNPRTFDADVYLADGEEFSVAGYVIKVIETPGHTPGGVCYYIPDEKILFSGDTLFESSVGRTDFPGGSMSAITRSISEKLMVLPDDTRVLPGHMDETDIGSEKKYNPYCSL